MNEVVATAALIVRRDTPSLSSGTAATDSSDVGDAIPTTTVFGLPSMTITPAAVWDALRNARYDPSGVGLVVAPADQAAAEVMPTAEQFGCKSADCAAMYNYVVWHEIAAELGFSSVSQMQDINPAIDFGQPPREGDVVQSIFGTATEPATTIDPNNETPTTISLFEGIMLIDGGAPAGAMEDAYQRLPGYNRVIVPGSGKTVEQTVVMPIDGNTAMAAAVGEVFGVDCCGTWDPSLLASPMQGMVAFVIGPDYYDHVEGPPPTGV